MTTTCWFCHGILMASQIKMVGETTTQKKYEVDCTNCGALYAVTVDVIRVNTIQGEALDRIKNGPSRDKEKKHDHSRTTETNRT